jgi:ParB-like nuclease family protein
MRSAQKTKMSRVSTNLPARDGLAIEWLPTESLKLSPNNPRTHSKRQIKLIARSIKKFGFMNPILIDSNGEIIAGHGRWEAANIAKLPKVPTLRFEHLSDAEKRAYILADNKIAEKGGWDREMLAIELQALVDMDFDIEVTGFEMDEVELILDETDKLQRPPSPEDVAPESLNGSATGAVGDLWILGKHRLYCGDAGDGQCDFIIRQWQEYTGQRAIRAKAGVRFDDVERQIKAEAAHAQGRRRGKSA